MKYVVGIGIGIGLAWSPVAEAGCGGAIHSVTVPLTQDTWVQQSMPTSNFGTKPQLYAGETSVDEFVGLFEFDYTAVKVALLDLKDGECLLDATLLAYAADVIGTQRLLAAATVESTDPLTATWNTQPGSFGVVDSQIVRAGWNKWAVAPSVDVWLDEFLSDREYNVGFLSLAIKSQDHTTSLDLFDSFDKVGGHPAYLEIVLQEP